LLFDTIFVHKRKKFRLTAATTISKVGIYASDQFPSLIELLNDKNPEIRISALTAIKRTGTPAKKLQPKIEVMLNDPDPDVSSLAAITLSSIGDITKEQSDKLAKMFDSKNNKVRMSALQALALTGSENLSNYKPAISTLLKDKDKYTRLNAIYALGEIGPPAEEHLDEIIQILNNVKDKPLENREEIIEIIKAITKIDYENKVEYKHVADLITSQNRVVKEFARQTLIYNQPNTQETIIHILGATYDKKNRVEDIRYLSLSFSSVDIAGL